MTDSSHPVTTADGTVAQSPHKTILIVMLIVSIVFTAAVLGGVKIIAMRADNAPLPLANAEAPLGDSPLCRTLQDSLPEELREYHRREIRDPAPAGAALYRRDTDEITIRCGVNAPTQYSVLSDLTLHGDTPLFYVKDATEGSTMRTWYSVGASPVVAISSNTDLSAELEDLGSLIQRASFPQDQAPTPAPIPLVEEKMATDSKHVAGDSSVCREFLAALPQDLEGYKKKTSEEIAKNSASLPQPVSDIDIPAGLVAWVADGQEPVVLRCGVEEPTELINSGKPIAEVNGLGWISDPSLSLGSTVGTWYGIDHEAIIALSAPTAASNSFISAIGELMSQELGASS